MTQPALFSIAPPPAREQTCKTCGASGPGPMFVEPVSGECVTCNHATIAEMAEACRAGDLQRLRAAYGRHMPGYDVRKIRLPRAR